MASREQGRVSTRELKRDCESKCSNYHKSSRDGELDLLCGISVSASWNTVICFVWNILSQLASIISPALAEERAKCEAFATIKYADVESVVSKGRLKSEVKAWAWSQKPAIKDLAASIKSRLENQPFPNHPCFLAHILLSPEQSCLFVPILHTSPGPFWSFFFSFNRSLF